MSIPTYISDLLYRYECVILPGFGAFLTQKESAYYNEEAKSFFPPRKQVSFNAQLKKNDGLLANYVSGALEITYPAALYKIDEFVHHLNEQLENEGKVRLENIGELKLSEGILQFEPHKEANYLSTAFGLDIVPAGVVTREVYKKQVEELEEKIPVRFTPQRRKTQPYLKYAAIGLLALGLTGFTGLNIYSNQVTEHNVAEIQAAETQLQQQIQQATFIIDNPLPEITFKVTKQSGDYHVVAGAFRIEENALQKVEELRQQGFTARYIGENKFKLHQVVYGSYQTRREALKMLWEAKKTNEGAWMLVQEL